ncbi:MAG: NAD(P)H nitroreductase [Actinomycetota bacterium]|nr:NAD(P)H nitroreductase [Actinomycetota bacterium]
MTATQVHTETIIEALRLACRAPSLHNSQPWRWVLTDRTVELYADPERLVRGTDSTGREALISCGAVLHHFRVALGAAGWGTTVTRFPDPADGRHLASVQISTAQPVTDEQRQCADAILARHTDRLPFAEPPGAEALMRTLSAVAGSSTVRLDVLGDDLHGFVAQTSHLTEALRGYDAEYHAELIWWTDDFVADDGIPRASLVSAVESDRVQIGRGFPVIERSERRTEISDDRATILVLSTLDDSPESVLRCGEALSAVLLDATAAGLATCTLTHVTEIPEGRDAVASLLGGGALPQALIRVGEAPALASPPPPTPRRPIHHVLRVERGR